MAAFSHETPASVETYGAILAWAVAGHCHRRCQQRLNLISAGRLRQLSVVLVEQYVSFVRQADWFYAMQKGGIVASGSAADPSKEMIQRFLSV